METKYKSSRIFVDIDGTLTKSPCRCWGEPNIEMIALVNQLIDDGHEVVIWSAAGRKYVMDFCDKYGIAGAIAYLGKPNICIDDCPTIRPEESMKIMSPEEALDD